ncbi:MAG: hypothetical protein AB1489_15995 [Acidobacteriota bacterium]
MYKETFNKLIEYCRKEDWQGYDPYDGLNSPLCQLLPPMKYARIAWIQFFKRSPLNLRGLTGIKKGENPKGLALFVRALLLAFHATGEEQYRRDAEELLERLWALRTPGYGDRMCWGYNFDWQSRAFYVPKGTPSIVCTTFVAHAWLDHYELFETESSLDAAFGACKFIFEDLNWYEQDDEICFSYTPLDHSQVHNANLLGAELLARVYHHTGEEGLCRAAVEAARFSIARQAADGSWPYGTAPFQSWIDSFHTGFNLISLDAVVRYCHMPSWQEALARGWQFYNLHFFLADGTPKYYHNKLYPIDIHAAAQAMVTFARLEHLSSNTRERLASVADWALSHMWDKEGYFYFQRLPRWTNKIPYMRWAQAWMAYALAVALFNR